MSQQFKFVNLNPFPIYLPCSRGGQVMFRSGEGSTQQWFSRFCGHKQLTKMGVTPAGKQVPVAPSTPPQPQTPPMAPPALKDVKLDVDVMAKKKPEPSTFPKEETDAYICENGVYRCKLCDRFMTGSHTSLQSHISSFHGQEKPIAKPQPVVTSVDEGETIVVSSRKSAAQRLPKEDGEPDLSTAMNKSPESAATAEESPEPEPTNNFPCTHAGCGKAFTTERGLKTHMMRSHK